MKSSDIYGRCTFNMTCWFANQICRKREKYVEGEAGRYREKVAEMESESGKGRGRRGGGDGGRQDRTERFLFFFGKVRVMQT